MYTFHQRDLSYTTFYTNEEADFAQQENQISTHSL